MGVRVTCPCGEWFGTHGALAGQRARCPGCGTGVVVPPLPAALIDDDGESSPPAARPPRALLHRRWPGGRAVRLLARFRSAILSSPAEPQRYG